MEASGPTHYQVLMVDPGVDDDVLTTVYRRLLQRLATLRDIGDREVERAGALQRASAVLHDPERRRRYDQAIGIGGERDAGPVRAPARAAIAVRPQPNVVPVPSASTSTARGSVLDFGRYAGWTLRQVALRDRDYLEWLRRTPGGRQYQAEIASILAHR